MIILTFPYNFMLIKNIYFVFVINGVSVIGGLYIHGINPK